MKTTSLELIDRSIVDELKGKCYSKLNKTCSDGIFLIVIAVVLFAIPFEMFRSFVLIVPLLPFGFGLVFLIISVRRMIRLKKNQFSIIVDTIESIHSAWGSASMISILLSSGEEIILSVDTSIHDYKDVISIGGEYAFMFISGLSMPQSFVRVL